MYRLLLLITLYKYKLALSEILHCVFIGFTGNLVKCTKDLHQNFYIYIIFKSATFHSVPSSFLSTFVENIDKFYQQPCEKYQLL